jgi:hypothetical protein
LLLFGAVEINYFVYYGAPFYTKKYIEMEGPVHSKKNVIKSSTHDLTPPKIGHPCSRLAWENLSSGLSGKPLPKK